MRHTFAALCTVSIFAIAASAQTTATGTQTTATATTQTDASTLAVEQSTAMADKTPFENVKGRASRAPGTWVNRARDRHNGLVAARLHGSGSDTSDSNGDATTGSGTTGGAGGLGDLGSLLGSLGGSGTSVTDLLNLANQFGLGGLTGGLTGTSAGTTATPSTAGTTTPGASTGTPTTGTPTTGGRDGSGTGKYRNPAAANRMSFYNMVPGVGGLAGKAAGLSAPKATPRSLPTTGQSSSSLQKMTSSIDQRSQTTDDATTNEPKFWKRLVNSLLQTTFTAITVGLQSQAFIDLLKDGLRPILQPATESTETDTTTDGTTDDTGSGQVRLVLDGRVVA